MTATLTNPLRVGLRQERVILAAVPGDLWR